MGTAIGQAETIEGKHERAVAITCRLARTLAFGLLLPVLASVGCDALTVRTFAGTVIELTLSGVTAQSIPTNRHLELWARTRYDDIVRVDGYTYVAAGATANGLMIRQAISPNDPCMLDGYYLDTKAGNLLTTAAAFPSSVSSGGITQTPDQQAQQVVDRINQITDNPTIQTGGPLLAILPYDPNVPPTVPADATSEERRALCDVYHDASDLTYIPNPYQITAPLHGIAYGFVKFTSVSPPTNYDGFRIDTPLDLSGVHEIFMTVEGDTVTPSNRGPLFLTSQLTQGGNDVVHFNLIHADPMGTASGTAALLVGLGQDPVQF